MDLNVQAFRLVQAAAAVAGAPTSKVRESARQGGIKGGRARTEMLSSERRSEIARKASNARWGAKTKVAAIG